MRFEKLQGNRRHFVLYVCLCVLGSACRFLGQSTVPAQGSFAAGKLMPSANVLLAPDKLSALLPPSVYFEGKSAPLQTRNAAGASLSGGAILWAALVDTSGYATDVQSRYQFYLVTESPLLLGKSRLAPGAYGGGFVGDQFVIMDIGGHTVVNGPVHTDDALKRPRPLQMTSPSATAMRLYLGRHWIDLQEDSTADARR